MQQEHFHFMNGLFFNLIISEDMTYFVLPIKLNVPTDEQRLVVIIGIKTEQSYRCVVG